MATTQDYLNYVLKQLDNISGLDYKKMFGEYIIYLNSKPVITICNNISYVKKLECIEDMMKYADIGYPYKGAKDHYVLNIEDSKHSKEIIVRLEKVISIPKKRK